MLMGVSPVIGPELIKILHEMGHGDEIVLADAFYPAHSLHSKVIRADGVEVPELLDGILALINLDAYVPDPLVMMAAVKGDELDPAVETSYRAAIEGRFPDAPATTRIGRFEFYERSKSAYAVIVTGTTAKYGNIIVKKGVVPVSPRYRGE